MHDLAGGPKSNLYAVLGNEVNWSQTIYIITLCIQSCAGAVSDYTAFLIGVNMVVFNGSRSRSARAVSILQGNLTIDISTEMGVSQPPAFSSGQTKRVEQSSVKAEETKARRVELHEGATVDDLVTGLQAIGASTRDVISILQAVKAAGALRAELEVI